MNKGSVYSIWHTFAIICIAFFRSKIIGFTCLVLQAESHRCISHYIGWGRLEYSNFEVCSLKHFLAGLGAKNLEQSEVDAL